MTRILFLLPLLAVCLAVDVTVDILGSTTQATDAGWAAEAAASYVNANNTLLSGHTLLIREHDDGCGAGSYVTAAQSLIDIDLNSSIGIVGPSCTGETVNKLSSLIHSLRDEPFITPFAEEETFSLVPDKKQVLWAMEQLCTYFGWSHVAVLYNSSETELEHFQDTTFDVVLIEADDLDAGLVRVAEAKTRIVLSVLDDCSSLVGHASFKTLSESGRVFVTWGVCAPPSTITGSVFAITQPTCSGAACTAMNSSWLGYNATLAAAVPNPTLATHKAHHLLWDATIAMARAAEDAGSSHFNSHTAVQAALKAVSFTGVTGPIQFDSAGRRSAFNWKAWGYDGTSTMEELVSFTTEVVANDVVTARVQWQGGASAAPTDTIASETQEEDNMIYVYIGAGVGGAVVLGLMVFGFMHSSGAGCKGCVEKKKHVMISYAHVDSEFALKVEEQLVAAGFKVWIDTAIVPAEDWRDNIARAIENAEAVVFIMSPKSVTSKYCKEEVYYSVNRDVPIFPIVAIDSWNDLSGGMKLILQRLQWIFFVDKPFDECHSKLVENLKTYKKNKGKSESKAQGHGHKGEGQQGTRMSVPDSGKPHLNVEVKPYDLYICYDSTDTTKGIAYAAFASKLAHHLRLSGVSCVLSARREVRDLDFEAEWEQLDAKKRARIAKEGSGTKKEEKEEKKTPTQATLPGMPDEPDNTSAPVPQKKGRKRDRKKNEEHDPFLAELTTHEKASTFLARNADEAAGVDTFEVNSLQIDQTMMMVFLLTPDAMQSGEMIDELHYTYECSKKIIVAKAYSGRESQASKKQDKAAMTGSVGIMLQSAETCDFGRCESHMNWGQKKAADSFPFDVLLLDLQLAVFKSKKETIMERDYAINEENALLNSGDDKKASSNANMVRLKKANLI